MGPPRLAGPTVLPAAPVLEIESAEPRYWRAASYDTFDGQGWSQSSGVPRRVDCRDALRESGPDARRLDISAKVLPGGSFTQLPVPLSPSKVCAGDAPVSFDESSLGLSVGSPLTAGARYTASSLVKRYSAETLRGASEDYSPEVREHYLQLPPGTPSRIRELALSVTAGESNQFDRARRIEAFLGRGGKYPYTLDPPATPRGRNGVDFFLFDIKRGYCSYFSSAMAVLLRSIGIPSRVVSGFAPGPWNARTRSVALTLPHAWVEVYFPGQGWVEFEPTPGGPARPDLVSGNAREDFPEGPGAARTDPALPWGAGEASVVGPERGGPPGCIEERSGRGAGPDADQDIAVPGEPLPQGVPDDRGQRPPRRRPPGGERRRLDIPDRRGGRRGCPGRGRQDGLQGRLQNRHLRPGRRQAGPIPARGPLLRRRGPRRLRHRTAPGDPAGSGEAGAKAVIPWRRGGAEPFRADRPARYARPRDRVGRAPLLARGLLRHLRRSRLVSAARSPAARGLPLRLAGGRSGFHAAGHLRQGPAGRELHAAAGAAVPVEGLRGRCPGVVR
ncbi:MAG TPA: hypothetical protein DCM05_04315 [Elusimicrobia bacterium]|nr:hypothetical protein [Elusimicrobiota bacterium]